ncbi:hypothetical protein NQ036_03575 [Brevibacterium sp. 91QC2O2]|uniref:hypothetical protein n=1 Tax=Brevibacterium TaxID=1696 RepID=UPI00211C0CC7|nr:MULTISPECIES: hypothetical protein [unclassified Brevibacterium]MCQ9367326.1 hypothetical protein [Brevibacterium sp. 91QC2O2]MCQ9384661.1 hypothetical protein [Brevibacterium sp. 68QC2CO]
MSFPVKLAAVAASATLLLTACSSSPAADAGSSNAGVTAEAAVAPDLTGAWEQKDVDQSGYQEATITKKTITIYWISDDQKTKSLYWAGSFTAPKTAGDYTWVSKNDKDKTAKSLLASDDKTKEFTYKDDIISYKASAMGSEMTIELKKK